MPVFEEIEACTTLNVEQCTITWTINNYSSIVKDVPGKYLSSPKFNLGNAAKRQFYLRLYPGGETEKSSQFISLYVYWNKTNNKQEFTCECKFSIITEVTGSIIHKRVFQAKVSNESPGWGYSEFYKKKDYNDMNSMIIRCQLSVFEDTSIDFDIKDHELINRLTFDSLFLSDELSDFKINTSSVKSIAAHKFILAVASPVFRAMFTHDMVENKENSIEIADTSYNILIDMLRYIYTGKILSTKTDEILELLAVADKYQIDNLKIKCGIKLCANLSVINAIEILTAAYKYNEEYLKNEVKHFVTTRIQSFFNSEEIKQIDDPDILIDLMQSMMKSQKIS